MKLLLTIALTVASVSAFASTVRTENVAFGLRFIDVTETCVEGDNLRTANKVTIYERNDMGDMTNWDVVGSDYLYTPMTYEKEICGGNGDACEFETVTMTIKRNYVFDVVMGGGEDVVIGHQAYRIPNCQ